MDNKGISIFNQVCEVNDLDPDKIREIAQKNKVATDTNEAEHLIRTAFTVKAQKVVKGLELGTTTGNEIIKDGEEYSISSDPAAPSFTINEDFIHNKYSEGEAEKLIDALGNVMLPVTG